MMLKMCSWLPLIHIMKPIMPTIFSGDVACEYSACLAGGGSFGAQCRDWLVSEMGAAVASTMSIENSAAAVSGHGRTAAHIRVHVARQDRLSRRVGMHLRGQ